MTIKEWADLGDFLTYLVLRFIQVGILVMAVFVMIYGFFA